MVSGASQPLPFLYVQSSLALGIVWWDWNCDGYWWWNLVPLSSNTGNIYWWLSQTIAHCMHFKWEMPRCPKCMVPCEEIGRGSKYPLHNFGDAVHIFSMSDHNPTAFHATCHDTSFKPTYHPFWEHLPFANIFLLITPNILHSVAAANEPTFLTFEIK